ncbi:conserved Plasmodium membrane protein, unknown function [Plasmodium berghei]|uniref:Transporter n=2 Tax=Plasmodium berghei TaxID=5821 RepID=A0A509AHJ7_PLABA|nr:conserved Plasmodium membrane protein, unknown function [Plasmodium berghei ANKA]CXH99845.1 conserved Plasmodium membrane protein, unknown function [Plasmodium berghei]SCL91612.1 conserved Plasmodium membrane protein, unknown function [Plasmodium berghei]SCM15497.1 conserved Plasmodium membrane protein, unknown function [Plasmodium berghei]SCM17289.1 conserved Plasmodium membrane protein, unknown function [Plasmodium berghei]VUC54262.1 conserved Plasmodium membrane protein, unknown function|eukprot:XP_034420095.1 conserved Plasmodium membrane protein, unknown function [Plasmodium berghei ANKA]
MVGYATGNTENININENHEGNEYYVNGENGNVQENYECENEVSQHMENELNDNLLNNDGRNKKKKNKYERGIFKSKNDNNKNTDENGNVPYRSFNDNENNEMDKKEDEDENNYKSKNKNGENNNNKKNKSDNQKFSEVYNSIYENLKKKKSGIKQKHGNNNEDSNINKYDKRNNFYEINYSSDHANSISSSIDGDSFFNDEVLKKYIVGQIFNIIRTSFQWAIAPFILFFLFEHYSIFYVYRIISFFILLLFTPISLYLIKKQNIKFFLLATNTTRTILWGVCIPILYSIYKDYIKKYYIDGSFEFLFCLLIIVDNMCINLSSIVDMDNNGIDYISKKYDIIITEKANRKYLTLHQFFFDVSFTIFNPLIVFVMYLFGRLFPQEYHRDLFVYLTSLYFAFISIISLVVYAIGLEGAESSSKREHINDNNYELQNSPDNIKEGNIKDNEGNENDFDQYYEKNYSNKSDQYATNYTNTYPSVYVLQSQVYNINDNYDPYSNKEIITLKDQYKKHFNNIKTNFKNISNDCKLLFYLSSLSFLNSVEDITTLMLIPFTSIFACEFFYVESLFMKVLIAVILISLVKCFENISYYCNKKNLIALKEPSMGMLLSGFSLVIYFFPFLLIRYLNIYIFLIFYTICSFLYIFFSTNLKATLLLNFQKHIKESKYDIYNFAGIFMSFVNSIFVISVIMLLSIVNNFVANYISICIFFIIVLFILCKCGNFVLKEDDDSVSTKLV